MNISFLGQGYEPESRNSVGNILRDLLARDDYHTFTGISAFASEAGVVGLGYNIEKAKNENKKFYLIVGIDEEGTSKEALLEILNLKINSYIFYQEEPPIFHPKIYLFEGEKEHRLILGSSNLTARGLFGNVESSLLVEFANSDEEGMRLLAELKSYYEGFFNFSDPNLFEVNERIIQDFVDKGIVPDETTRTRRIGKKMGKGGGAEGENGLIIPKRPIARIPKEYRRKPAYKAIIETEPSVEITVDPDALFELVWDSGELTERDLTIPKGKKTHQTGSMNFRKGLLENIDQRHYFRDTVFSELIWSSDIILRTQHIERAFANFKIIILEEDLGDFTLKLSHNTKKDSKTYLQGNCMTSLSWGKARALIAKKELIGKKALLFKNVDKNGEFTLVIE